MEGLAAAGTWLGSLFTSGTVASGAAAGGLGQAAAYGAGTALAGAAVSSLLQPKMPKVKAPTSMPDQSAVDEGRRRSLLQQLSRRGRASTILTDPAGDTLG